MRLTPMLVSTALALGAASPAQTVYTVKGTAGAFASVTEQSGPPAGPCGWPDGPSLGTFTTNASLPCPTPVAFPGPPALGGDVAVAGDQNLVYVTDGTTIARYSPGGTPLKSLTLASVAPTFGTITGLGYAGTSGILWVSSATSAIGISVAGAGSCPTQVLVVTPPFNLPDIGASYTDIDWDPVSGSLFACTTAGSIVNVYPGGLPGPYGITTPSYVCVTGPLYGLAMDDAAFAGPAAMYVTDGTMIERVTPSTGAPPPTFYATSTCFPAVSPPVSGLAASAHAISFGLSSGPNYPVLFSSGQSITPNYAFQLLLAAPPDSIAAIFLGAGPLCPPLQFGSTWLYLTAPELILVAAVPSSGFLEIPVPIPASMPIPATVYLQGVEISGGGYSGTNGLALSFARP